MPEEYCEAESFEAEQLAVPGNVIIRAWGVHPTSGFIVRFSKRDATALPPEFDLLHTPPDEPVEDEEREFFKVTRFHASERVERVTVYDRRGAHHLWVGHNDDEEALPIKSADDSTL
jgi:hypothetical protein